jgi:hypothetical protein
MRDGGEPPIRRSLGPNHHEENRATCNLAREKCKERRVVGVEVRGRAREKINQKNFGKLRVNDKKRRRRVTFILDHCRTETESQASWYSSGVASGKSIWSR